MRCPKCHYLGFDSGERCRNCGYDFSLSEEPVNAPELPIRIAEPIGPLPDLSLDGDSFPSSVPRAGGRRYPEFDLDLPPRSGSERSEKTELPLFSEDTILGGSGPMVAPRAARPPLSVRRGTPEVVRLRSKPHRRNTPGEPGLDLGAPTFDGEFREARGEELDGEEADQHEAPAGVLDRLTAAMIDGTLLAAIDLAVLYFTIRLCGLTYDEILIVPWAPMLGFFALLNGGYFVAFTATSGQTIGKMARRIRVTANHGPLHAGQAILRTAAYLASALPVGLGFAGALLGADRLALHDRLADTRVIKVLPS